MGAVFCCDGEVLTLRKSEWTFSPLTIGSPMVSEMEWGMEGRHRFSKIIEEEEEEE